MAFGRDTDPQVGKETQWKPGVQPPGAGKPKGAKHLSTWISEALNDETFETEILENYKLITIKGAPAAALIKVALRKALGGDQRWADWLAKYGPKEAELPPPPQNPIVFINNVPMSE